MKKALLIIVLAAAITSCCKKQNTACYRCEHMRTVHGRGAVRIDTLCGMDYGQIRAYEVGEYISNDSVQQSTNCAAL